VLEQRKCVAAARPENCAQLAERDAVRRLAEEKLEPVSCLLDGGAGEVDTARLDDDAALHELT
jgi:hypothetical protein